MCLLSSPCLAQRAIVEKPNIPSDKLLTKQERVLVKKYLKGKASVNITPAKNDYKDRYDRGTVHFDPKKGINMLGREVFKVSNYGFHKVIIPDGTIIHNVNFTQRRPFTEAIQGKNLTFINCNMTNIKKDPTWTYERCLEIQMKRRKFRKDGKWYRRQYIIPKGGSTWQVCEDEEDGEILEELITGDEFDCFDE
jgi:hypothetical protein